MHEKKRKQRLRRRGMQRRPRIISLGIQAERLQHRARHAQSRHEDGRERHEQRGIERQTPAVPQTRPADASRKGARNPIDMLRAMDENGCQQGQTKPFVRRHARQRGKRCKRISQKRREINNEHPLHQVTSPLKAFARSEQAARRARPAPRSRGSSWHRTRGDSASPAYPTHDTRRWRSPPRDRPSRARHPARAHRRNHGTTPTRTRRPGKASGAR